ncbi:MAG: phospholipid carrier-dependent glycosyltransferase [Caldilineae bacterium]|nr:phospholipid carrier-dependent glycosyltransferase [Caldilineae bacterium]
MRPPTERRLEILLGLLLLLAAAWLRLGGPGRYIASDELRWTCRAINFHAALVEGRPADTFQVGHPGVLTMWLGSLALPLEAAGDWRQLCDETQGGKDLTRFDDLGNEGLLQTITPRIFAIRRGVALGSTLLLALAWWLMRAGLGLAPVSALGALSLLAFEPFVIAHSRVMHVDALLAGSCLAAILALAAWARRFAAEAAREPGSPAALARSRSRRWALAAGALAGLAMLAKSAGFVLGPFALAGLAWQGLRRRRWRAAASDALAWGTACGLVYVALWPAMWVDPLGSLLRDCETPTAATALAEAGTADAVAAAEAGADDDEGACNSGVLVKLLAEGGVPHQNGNYFMGRPVADPGPFFYPLAILFRSSPWALLGLLLALGASRPRWPAARRSAAEPGAAAVPADADEQLALRWLLAWALVFLLLLTPGAKKMDRYMLPALMALAAAAGIALTPRLAAGLDGLMRLLGRRLGPSAGLAALLSLALVAGLEASGPRARPYPLTWYNPLLGGSRGAESVLLIGWGEGYDLAAEFLNAQPNAASLEVAARGVANLGPLFAGRTESMGGYQPGRTDWVVVYRSQVQRRQDEALLALYHDRPSDKAAYVGRINGLDMVWVYPNASLAPLRERLAELATAEDIVIAGGETVLARGWDLAGPAAGRPALYRYWGHWAAADVERELLPTLPEGWRRAWVLRYPGYDPPATEEVLSGIARRGRSERIDFVDGSAVEITEFTRTDDS